MKMQLYFSIMVLTVLLVSGCNRNGFRTDTQLIEGKVLLEGSPIKGATVTFHPQDKDGELASGYTNEKGKFVMSSLYGNIGKGVVQGDYKVTISQLEVKTIPSKTGNPDDDITVSKELLPNIYQDQVNTPLIVAVKKGKNLITFDLKNNP